MQSTYEQRRTARESSQRYIPPSLYAQANQLAFLLIDQGLAHRTQPDSAFSNLEPISKKELGKWKDANPASVLSRLHSFSYFLQVQDVDEFSDFTAIVFTKEHGAYCVRRPTNIKRSFKRNSPSLHLEFRPLAAIRTVTVTRWLIFNPEGECLNPNDQHNPVHLMSGDSLIVSYTLTAS